MSRPPGPPDPPPAPRRPSPTGAREWGSPAPDADAGGTTGVGRKRAPTPAWARIMGTSMAVILSGLLSVAAVLILVGIIGQAWELVKEVNW